MTLPALLRFEYLNSIQTSIAAVAVRRAIWWADLRSVQHERSWLYRKHQGPGTALQLFIHPPLFSSLLQKHRVHTNKPTQSQVPKGNTDKLDQLHHSAILEHLCLYKFPFSITLTLKHTNNEEYRLTCCSSSEESWWSPSCAGWESPPWQQPSLCLLHVYPRCSVCPFPIPRFTSASPPNSLAQRQSPITHCFSWVTSHYLTIQTLLSSSFPFRCLSVDAIQCECSGLLLITHE